MIVGQRPKGGPAVELTTRRRPGGRPMRDEAAVPVTGGAAGSVVAERSGPDPLSRFRLDDRVALVAGGGGAIGSAIARAFAAAGARTVIVDQTGDRAEAAAELLRVGRSEVLALGADL